MAIRALDASQASIPTPVEFEACEFDPSSLQPHWGSKMINEALNRPGVSLEQLPGSIREATTASAERLRSLSMPTIDDGVESLHDLRNKAASSMNFDMPSLEVPSINLPHINFPDETNILGRANDVLHRGYHETFDSSQNILADRVDRLGNDISSLASENIVRITPDAVQQAAMNVLDDLHSIKGALDDHKLVFLPTLRDALDSLSHSSQLDPHFGTELIVAISKATAADVAILLSELARFIGMSKAIGVIIDFFVL